MKRLVGGEYLLDLSSIELEESEDGSTKTNITDANVLAQLTNLKKYVKNPEMAKPVWVKLLNGENDELVIARGTFAVVDTGEFEICVQLDGYKLVIFIEFTQAELDDHTPIDDWYIDTNDAKYLFTSDAQNVKATIEDEDFGDVDFAGDLSVGGDLSVTGKINDESNPSVKPIYCHPVTIRHDATKLILTCLIFNNDSTPLTLSTFKDFIDNLTNVVSVARIMVSGAFTDSSSSTKLTIASYIYKIKSSGEYGIFGQAVDTSGIALNQSTTFTDVFPTGTLFYDDVNKIN